MSDYFHCDICDKSIKIRSKKRHLNSQYHKSLIKSIICKHTIENPNFFEIENLLHNFVDKYNKDFELYIIYCKWKLHFSDNTIFVVKSDRLYNINRYNWDLRRYLLSKIEYQELDGPRFSYISEMNIVFIRFKKYDI